VSEPAEPRQEDPERLRRLLRIQQLITGRVAEFPAPEVLFENVLGDVCRELDWHYGAWWAPARGGDELRMRAVWVSSDRPEMSSFVEVSRGHTVTPGKGLPGSVWATGEAHWVPDVLAAELPRARAGADADLGSALAFPLLLGDTFEGVVEVAGPSVLAPDANLLATLSASGAQLAQYLDRWRTHATLMDAESRWRTLVEQVPTTVYLLDWGDPPVPRYVNPQVEALLGFPIARWYESGFWASRLHHEDRERVGGIVERALTDRTDADAEYRLIHADGHVVSVWDRGHFDFAADGSPRALQGVVSDITALREAEAQVEFLAYHDSLTHLANRALLAEHLELALERARRHDRRVALLYLDLDDFKLVNDRLGHAAGDELLCRVADRLRSVTRSTDLLARPGGDEFLLLLADVEESAWKLASRVAGNIHDALVEPMPVGEEMVTVSASIGVSTFPLDADGAGALLQHADAAMYRAKRSGGGCFAMHGTEDPGRLTTGPSSPPDGGSR
jgi:diguanylate cyclase (GGDEF)-like protein/PAS domain S-box-containing protein